MTQIRRISSKGFKDILSYGTNDSPFILENSEEITGNFHNLQLRKVVFEHPVSFREVVYHSIVQFEDCEFESVEFVACHFSKSFSMTNCKSNGKVTFINCSFDTLVVEKGEYQDITFRGTIKESTIGENKVSFLNAKINDLIFRTKEVVLSVDFKGCIIEDLMFFETKVGGSLNFTDAAEVKMITTESCEFGSRIDFNKSKSKTIYLSRSSFAESLVFSEDCNCEYLTLSEINSRRLISINYQKNNIGSIDINDLSAEGTFNILSDFKGEPKAEIGTLQLSLTGKFYGFLSVENISLSPNFSVINFGTIHLNNIRTKIFSIDNFHNYGKLTVSNLFPDEDYNCLLIYDSNIQATEFINVNFKEFDEVVIAKSNVSGLILSNSFLPNRIQTETIAPQLGYKIVSINRITDESYKRENYRQLRIAMENQGSRREALRYKSLEMHYLRKDVAFGWDKLLLYLNYLSNNHGLSWSRGVLFTVLSSLGFFLMYQTTIPSPSFWWTGDFSLQENKEAFKNGAIDFLRYLSSFPTLRFSDDGDGFWTNVVVILSRIFAGYGIYQTIVAFRKYGAK